MLGFPSVFPPQEFVANFYFLQGLFVKVKFYGFGLCVIVNF